MPGQSYYALENEERRRAMRYLCGGPAKLTILPWMGSLLCGRLGNLGLGGCFIQEINPLACGTRTELVLRVNALSLRAVGLVRNIGRNGLGIEFVQMSAGARCSLEELIEELKNIRIPKRSFLTQPALPNRGVPIIRRALPFNRPMEVNSEDLRSLQSQSQILWPDHCLPIDLFA